MIINGQYKYLNNNNKYNNNDDVVNKIRAYKM